MNDQSHFVELNGKLERLMDGIDSVKEKQEEMADDLTKIKDAVYDPDQGLYARLRNLEQWKEASARVQWIIITSLLGLGLATIWNVMVQQ